MFDFEGIPYPVIFANYQCNSWVPADVKSTLVPAWMKEYAAVDENAVFVPIAVLASGSHIGIRCGGKLLVYDRNGQFRFLEPISEAAPVVFGREAMAFVQPSLKLIYQDYARVAKGAGRTIPGLEQWAYSLLLKPEPKEIVAAIQFTGGPLRKPKRFSACALVLRNGARRWFFDIDGSVDHLLVTHDGRKMVLVCQGKVELRNIQDGSIISTFETGVDACPAASLDKNDNLLLMADSMTNDLRTRALKAFDLSGKALWMYSGLGLHVDQPPPCGGEGLVYLVNGQSLECISKGTCLWSYPLKSADKSWVTIAKDGSSVVLNGPWLSVVNPQGERLAEKLVSTDAEETFDAPPVIDSNGRILVASGQRLYCFR